MSFPSEAGDGPGERFPVGGEAAPAAAFTPEDPLWASMIKQALKRRNPGFNERAYGFRSFNDLLLEAQKRGLLRLTHDEKSGGYTVRVAE